jgi:hypothetical protein
LLEGLKITLAPFDNGCVAPFFERLFCLGGVFFFCGKEVDFGGFVLDEVRDDAVANACGAAGDYIDLDGVSRGWCWEGRGEVPCR